MQVANDRCRIEALRRVLRLMNGILLFISILFVYLLMDDIFMEPLVLTGK